eukprot:COSAG02_NODE_30630_length_547_cov_4.279018_1_plen_49_part_10
MAIGQPAAPVVLTSETIDEDDRRILPPTILRDQQRSTYTTCVEVAGRTL